MHSACQPRFPYDFNASVMQVLRFRLSGACGASLVVERCSVLAEPRHVVASAPPMRASFYTDASKKFGSAPTEGTDSTAVLPRFAAWVIRNDKPRVEETGDDLEKLRKRFGDAPVVVL